MSSERISLKGLRISDAIVTSVGGELVVGARVVAARDEQRVELKIANHLLHVLHPSRLDLDAVELGKGFVFLTFFGGVDPGVGYDVYPLWPEITQE